ncbi:YybH family protein [Archangium sp.]|uniref:YybH family protein n=1 Tax=Archangium sp. TaxID=1872627 RepID=UPI00389AA97E
MTPEEEVLLRTDREFNAATQARGGEGWAAYFSPTGVMLRATGHIIGPEAIRATMTPVFATPGFSLTWEPQRAELSAGGRLGFTTGRYLRRSRDASGAVVESRGTYMNFWEKQPDGSWKVSADVGDPDGA